jgi:two-component sensor histidine kinase
MDVQKVILNLDTSIPAGLIINELVTNSIKHAFSSENDGIILINLYTKNNVLFLEVSDNGKGFPKEVDFKNTNSLGLQLVNTLVEQLNGTIKLTENKYKGSSFFITFPM